MLAFLDLATTPPKTLVLIGLGIFLANALVLFFVLRQREGPDEDD